MSTTITTLLVCPRCSFVGEPALFRTTTSVPPPPALGAWCTNCSRFIKWVGQTTPWLNLEARQKGPATTPHVATVREDWLNAIIDMANEVWDTSEANGFHDKGYRSVLERAMLVVTECAELAEAERNGAMTQKSEHIPDFTQGEEEWADIFIRVLDHSRDDGITPSKLGLAIIAKMTYNRTRGYRHGGKTI